MGGRGRSIPHSGKTQNQPTTMHQNGMKSMEMNLHLATVLKRKWPMRSFWIYFFIFSVEGDFYQNFQIFETVCMLKEKNVKDKRLKSNLLCIF